MIALFEHFVMRPTRQKRIDKKFDIFLNTFKNGRIRRSDNTWEKGASAVLQEVCVRVVGKKRIWDELRVEKSRRWKKTTEERVCRFWVCWDHNHRFFFCFEKKLVFSSSSSSKWLFFSGIFSILVSVQPLLGIRRYDKVYVVNSYALCDVTGWRGVCLHFLSFREVKRGRRRQVKVVVVVDDVVEGGEVVNVWCL